MSVVPPCLAGFVAMNVLERADGLRCRETPWLRARRAELVVGQRRARAEELAIVAVLDERGALDACEAARSGVSAQVERETLETARALEIVARDRRGSRGGP